MPRISLDRFQNGMQRKSIRLGHDKVQPDALGSQLTDSFKKQG